MMYNLHTCRFNWTGLAIVTNFLLLQLFLLDWKFSELSPENSGHVVRSNFTTRHDIILKVSRLWRPWLHRKGEYTIAMSLDWAFAFLCWYFLVFFHIFLCYHCSCKECTRRVRFINLKLLSHLINVTIEIMCEVTNKTVSIKLHNSVRNTITNNQYSPSKLPYPITPPTNSKSKLESFRSFWIIGFWRWQR